MYRPYRGGRGGKRLPSAFLKNTKRSIIDGKEAYHQSRFLQQTKTTSHAATPWEKKTPKWVGAPAHFGPIYYGPP